MCELDTISFIECTLEATVVPKLKLEKESDQVCDPIPVSMQWIPAHIPEAKGEHDEFDTYCSF